MPRKASFARRTSPSMRRFADRRATSRRRLYLSLAQSRMLHGQVRYNIASRFIDEIPRELVQWLSPRERRRAFDVDQDPWSARTWSTTPASANANGPRATPPPPAWRIG